MIPQKELIDRKDWDVLIILDACRYDYFKNVYENYLSGELRKAESEGHRTSEWLAKTWADEKPYNLTYVSANPFINSLGIDRTNWGYNPTEHFERIIDLWKSEWDENLETVLPKRVNYRFIDEYAQNSNERFVVHYIQPHYPFLSIGPELHGVSTEQPNQGVRGRIGVIMTRFFGRRTTNKLRDFLGLKNEGGKTEYEAVAENHGVDGLREYYLENIRIVVEKVSQIVPKIDGRIVVTSDHGDFLGENGCYGHGDFHPFLREVPWLEMEQ